MKKFMTYATNHKGITLVLMAIMLIFLLIFAALAIDISYMYFEKNQLQVAADAAALAGAALIKDPNDDTQLAARDEAIRFAANNRTARTKSNADAKVQLITTYTNSDPTVSADNDISVGYWDGAQYLRGKQVGKPINAMEVVPKRTAGLSEESGRGPIRVFLGKIFSFLGSDWAKMSAKSIAIATKPLRASSFIALCRDDDYLDPCDNCTLDECAYNSPHKELSTTSSTSSEDAFAWTSLLTQQTGPGSSLDDLICSSTPYVDICNNTIFTTMGAVSHTLRDLEADMFDPNYDSANKIIEDGLLKWTLIVPVTKTCPPGEQGKTEPKETWGFARIRLVAICETGGGNACAAYAVLRGWTEKNEKGPSAPQGLCKDYSNKAEIVIDRIQCISCEDADDELGLKPVLVK